MLENNPYSQMQENFYNNIVRTGGTKDDVVGSFDAHNRWKDYEYLFIDIDNLSEKKCLDFGCGPGRNLVKYHSLFQQMDGVDLCQANLDMAKQYWQETGLDANNLHLYKSNGFDIQNVPDNTYDVVMSTICFQHICVYDIRLNLLKEFHRVLKSGGSLSIQMGFGSPSNMTVDYYENNYGATGTNRLCDTRVDNINQIESDLQSIGYNSFKSYITQVGPGDFHPNWIFFNAKK